jgi:ABC-type bacteriocin/lantibiotic exporter with double-glycine peptidase domain
VGGRRLHIIPYLLHLLFFVGLTLVLVSLSSRKPSWRMANDFRALQQQRSDCGPASLQKVMEHFGESIPIATIRSLSGTSQKGTSMLGLKHCAERFGFNCAGWNLAAEDLLQIPLPAIVFLDEGHFVVLETVSRHRVFLNDPARGARVLPLTRFLERWSGDTLILQPKEGGSQN